MSDKEIIDFLKNEKRCAVRNINGKCNRDCKNCDLVLPDDVVLDGYDCCINLLESIMCENNMLRKMRPVVLNGESARSFALALELSELKSKLPKWVHIKQVSDLPRKCGRYNVCLVTSHHPTSTYDSCDFPYEDEIVTSAYYDNEQKLWILCEECTVNAMLIVLDDTPMNGQYISHWCEFPLSPNKMENSE
jgi:hypothetical protein